MRYTDKELSINPLLVEKLEFMVDRVVNHKFDNLIILDGNEGYGKSNLASAIAYFLAWKSKRAFSENNVFFLVDDMINFAVKTEKQVIWWDESALGALASESYSKVQTKLLKLLMVARKKQHFYIFVIPKYFRLREAIIDRAIALIHIYSRDGVTRGRFAYYKQDAKEKLYQYWRSTKDKGYKKFYSFLGSFSETLPLVIDEKEYDRRKDLAILSIGGQEVGEKQAENLKEDLKKLQRLYATIPNLTQQILAKHASISVKTLGRWKNLQISPISQAKRGQGQADTLPIREVNPSQDGFNDEGVDDGS